MKTGWRTGWKLLLAGCLLLTGGCLDDVADEPGETGAETLSVRTFDLDALSRIDRPFGYAMGDLIDPDTDFDASARVDIATSICPGSTTLDGIDVSYYQGTINWSTVKSSGVRFAMIRVSDGTTFMDPQFEANWKNAKAARVVVGAYQFFRPNQDATAQADIMVDQLNAMGFTRLDLPPVIDVETTSGVSNSTVLSQVNIWLQRVQLRTGRMPTLYTSPGFWSGIGNPTPTPLPNLWVAHWTSNCPTIPPPWTELQWWQYSSSGSVPGISGAVDLDLFNGPMIKMILL